MCLLPRLTYALPITNFTEQHCTDILKLPLYQTLPKLQINRNISKDIIHGAQELGGMGIHHLYAEQAIQQLKHIIGHIERMTISVN